MLLMDPVLVSIQDLLVLTINNWISLMRTLQVWIEVLRLGLFLLVIDLGIRLVGGIMFVDLVKMRLRGRFTSMESMWLFLDMFTTRR